MGECVSERVSEVADLKISASVHRATKDGWRLVVIDDISLCIDGYGRSQRGLGHGRGGKVTSDRAAFRTNQKHL